KPEPIIMAARISATVKTRTRSVACSEEGRVAFIVGRIRIGASGMKGYAQSNTRSSRTYPRLDERLNSRQTDLLVSPWSGRQSSVPGWALRRLRCSERGARDPAYRPQRDRAVDGFPYSIPPSRMGGPRKP